MALFSDPNFGNGRTVSGTITGTDVEVLVLFPNSLNERVDGMEPGSDYSVTGVVAQWDGLRELPIVRADGDGAEPHLRTS